MSTIIRLNNLIKKQHDFNKTKQFGQTIELINSLLKMASKHAPKISLTKEQINELKDVFVAIDKDGNGVLDVNELGQFMKDADLQPEFAPLAIKLFDTDHDGTISWPEFIQFIDVILSGDPLKLFQLLFKVLDLDNSGELSAKEVKEFLSFFGVDATDKEIGDFIQSVDTDGNGTLSFDEVMQFLADQ